MATPNSLPGVKGRILDNQLGISPEPTILNDSILIIGTASDGPMYEPIPLQSKEIAEATFGAFGNGTLVRGFYEAQNGTIEGTPDIRGLRIGNGLKASLDIAEKVSTASTSDEVTTGATSLKLEANVPGSIYNAVSVYLDENRKINIYNPKTGEVSAFTYDDVNMNDTSVDCRNVRELVNAINADPNLNTILTASTSGLIAQFEIEVNAASSGIVVAPNGKSTAVTLSTVLQDYSVATPHDVVPTGYIYSPVVSKTAGNLLDGLVDVFSISVSEPTLLEIKGKASVKTTLMPFDGKNDSRFDTIQCLEDYDTDNKWQYNPTGNVASEYVSYLDRYVLPNVTVGGAASGTVFTLSIPGLFAAPDDSAEVVASGSASWKQTVTSEAGVTATTQGILNGSIAHAWAIANSGTFVPQGYVTSAVSGIASTVAEFKNITCSGFSSSLAYPGKIIVEVSTNNGVSDSDWAGVLYHPVSGIYISGFAINSGTGVITLAIGAEASGYTGNDGLVNKGLINTAGTITENMYIRLSCTTCKDFLTEVTSLPSLQSASDWRSYFVRGNEIVFGTVAPVDVVLNYGVKTSYEIGTEVSVTDAAKGEVKFIGSIQPGPGGAALDTTKKSIIGFNYTYLPQFPAVTTAAQSLAGGSNGVNINNATLYNELAKAYTALENYEVQIVVPMDAFLDSTKNGYNSITGLPETVNAQFQVQLNTFLDQLSTDVHEARGVIGVTPATSNSLADVGLWVKRLTIQDLNDPNRGANIMPLLNSRYIDVTAIEPLFDNLGGLPYTANGQASYAGMVSSLAPHQSPTNKSIPNATRSRFTLSNSQLEALQASRYVALRTKTGRNPVICSAMTAAAPGSDFVRLTTVRITFAAMDVVRDVCDPFIGQPNTAASRNAMEAAITKGLHSMVEVGALRKYAFTVTSSPNQQVLGIIDIELLLVPVFEIQTIRTTVKLRTDLPANG